MKQLLVISEAKARREQKCLPIHYSVIMQRNGLILSSDPSRQDRTLGLVTDLQENCTQPLCVWWQPCAGPSSGGSQGWRLLQKVCTDCPDAPGTSAGGRTLQDYVQLKHKCPEHMSRWEQAMHVCKYRVPSRWIYVKMSLKRAEVWGFRRPQLCVQSCTLKAKFTMQLGGWLQRTAPMISALHAVRASVERYFCTAYSFMPLSWHRLACMFPAGNAASISQLSPFANSTYRELHPAKPGAAPALQPGKADRVRRTGPQEQCHSGKGTQISKSTQEFNLKSQIQRKAAYINPAAPTVSLLNFSSHQRAWHRWNFLLNKW